MEWQDEIKFREERIYIPASKQKGKKSKRWPQILRMDKQSFWALQNQKDYCDNLSLETAIKDYPDLEKLPRNELIDLVNRAKRYVFPGYVFLGNERFFGKVGYQWQIARGDQSDLTLHDLRRTCATKLFLKVGGKIIIVKEKLHHLHASTTLKYLNLEFSGIVCDAGIKPVKNNPFRDSKILPFYKEINLQDLLDNKTIADKKEA